MTKAQNIKAILESNFAGFKEEIIDIAVSCIMSLDQEPCEDAISRILKRMWNCRGKYTTSIDKVAMERIIREELPSITQKPIKCDDAISRHAALDLMRSLTRWCVRSEDGKFNNVGLLYDDVMFGIDKLSSVNPQEPKTGEWKRNETIRLTYCSECGFGQHIDEYRTYNYCPNCGAKMVEPQESEEQA